VLTIGMAVDSNVLIYERIREEVARGAALRMAIRNGFSKALSAIIDSNLTTILTAVILYIIGTEQLRGFAVTLILGLAISMFTAVFCSRLLFDIAERRRWLTEVKMMKFFEKTNFNFLRVKGPAIAASLVVILIGLGAVYARGKGLLDIDFTGGTATQAVFKEGVDLDTNAVDKIIRQWNESIDQTADENLETSKANLLNALAKSSASLDSQAPASATSPSASSEKLIRTLQVELADRLERANSENTEFTLDEIAALKQKLRTIGESLSKQEKERLEQFYHSDAVGQDQLRELRELAKLEDFTAPVTNVPLARGEGYRGPYLNTSNSSQVAVERILEKLFENQLLSMSYAEAPVLVSSEKTSGKAAKKESEEQDKKASDAEGEKEAKRLPEITTIFEVTFTDKMSEGTVLSALQQAAKQTARATEHQSHLTPAVIDAIKLDNPQRTRGTQAFANWRVTINAPAETARAVLEKANELIQEQPLFPASNNFGGLVSAKMRSDGIFAIIASWIGILVYLWIRFQKVSFGVAAVVALIHDVLIALSFMALSAWMTGIPFIDAFKINLDVVAAFLTLIGYSVNDTIVIFDRVREIKGKSPDLTADMINRALNETLSRTIITSGLTFLVVLAQFFFGGQSIHAFAFCLVIGLIAGTYSTIYIASPVLLWMNRLTSKPQRHLQPSVARPTELVPGT